MYRVVYTSTYSTAATRIAYDEFNLTIRDPCYNSVATLVAGVDDVIYLVDTANTVGEDYEPDFDPDSGCGYALTIRIKEATQPDSDYETVG